MGNPSELNGHSAKNGLPLQERLVICVQRRHFDRIEDRQKVQFALFPWIDRVVIHLPLDLRLVLEPAQSCPRFSFRARYKRAVSRIEMCQGGVFIRRKFPARSAFAP